MTHARRYRPHVALLAAVSVGAGALIFDGSGPFSAAQAQQDDEKKAKGGDDRKRERQPDRRPPSPPPPKREVTPQPQTQQPRFRQEGPAPRRDLQKPPAATDTGPRFKKDEPPPSARDRQRPLPPDRAPGSPEFKTGDPPSKEGTPVPRRIETAPAPRMDGLRRPPPAAAGPAPKHLDDLKRGRVERLEDGGRSKVIREPGNRFIVKQDNKAIIRRDESERFRRRPDAKSVRRADGSNETYYLRKDGSRVITITDDNGRLLRRYRRGRDGREFNIIDNRRFYRGLGVGIGLGGIIALNLGMPRITIPRERYIVDYEHASDDDLYETLIAPPVEDLDRAYALDEIRYSYELRARMRRIDLDTITFEFGAWEVPPAQYQQLERIARIMLRVLERNSEAVFLIEGHTDAVGSDDDNLSLADRRASAVADILTDTFDVPPENLVTQGYGEQYLKVDTQGPERLNRRVTIINITRLMAER